VTGPVPVLLLAATDPRLYDDVVAGMMVDLPQAVCLAYRRDADGALRRRVSDWSGSLYDELVAEGSACVSRAVRADLPETAQLLAAQDRWSCVVAAAPATVSPQPLAHALQQAIDAGSAPDVVLAPVVALVGIDELAHDLLGDDLLDDRGLALSPGDRRSVGESLVAQIEYADVVMATDEGGPPHQLSLLRAVCAGSTVVHPGWSTLDVLALVVRGTTSTRPGPACTR